MQVEPWFQQGAKNSTKKLIKGTYPYIRNWQAQQRNIEKRFLEKQWHKTYKI